MMLTLLPVRRLDCCRSVGTLSDERRPLPSQGDLRPAATIACSWSARAASAAALACSAAASCRASTSVEAGPD